MQDRKFALLLLIFIQSNLATATLGSISQAEDNIHARSGLVLSRPNSTCLPVGDEKPGFHLRLFSYPLVDEESARDIDFIDHGYASKTMIYERDGITDPSLNIPVPCLTNKADRPLNCWWDDTLEVNEGGKFTCQGFECRNTLYSINYGEIFGFPTTTSNFTMELTGYFKAPQTGEYEISINSDDVAIIQIGSDRAFSCCKQLAPPPVTDDITLYSEGGSIRRPDQNFATLNMVEGYYYPIRIVYINIVDWGMFNLRFKYPNGKEIGNLRHYVVTIPNNPKQLDCDVPDLNPPAILPEPVLSTVFITDNGLSETIATSSTNSIGEDGKTTPYHVYYVGTTPIGTILSTIFTTDSGLSGTLSTHVSHRVGDDGRTTPETIYVVGRTPIDGVESTSFTTDSRLSGTLSTHVSHRVGDDGRTTPETIYVVGRTPIDGVESTSFTTDSGLSGTLSTHVSHRVGDDGRTTPETIYVAGRTPIDGVESTSFTTDSGLSGTLSTHVSHRVGDDGRTTPETIYVVGRTPIDGVESTSFTTDSGLSGTLSTHYGNRIGKDSNTTPVIIFIVGTSNKFTQSSSTTLHEWSKSSLILFSRFIPLPSQTPMLSHTSGYHSFLISDRDRGSHTLKSAALSVNHTFMISHPVKTNSCDDQATTTGSCALNTSEFNSITMANSGFSIKASQIGFLSNSITNVGLQPTINQSIVASDYSCQAIGLSVVSEEVSKYYESSSTMRLRASLVSSIASESANLNIEPFYSFTDVVITAITNSTISSSQNIVTFQGIARKSPIPALLSFFLLILNAL